jgi:UV DNA damage endonuclease
MTRAQYLKLGKTVALPELSRRAYHNCKLLSRIILHCHSQGIAHYRVSSSMFPLVTDSTLGLSLESLPDYAHILSALASAGELARKLGVSVSMHPDQFNVLVSYNPLVIDRSINELNHQSHILDLMGYSQDLGSPMCLHLNATPKLEKERLDQYRERFLTNLRRCSLGVQARLVLENEDKGYWNCTRLYETFGDVRALVYDNHHDACNASDSDMAHLFAGTWGAARPVFHWSEGIDGGRSHADYASHVPKIVSSLAERVTWEVELKAKDHAIAAILGSLG